ncbi:MAG: polyphosphate kinase, partial [SAR86 cluster bacterium]|nr:polyphosphate kinase [SAR86 cluster bacterium]MDG1202855.1 polyphosphate kinase [SAR86 cluster bacterium]
WVAINANNKMIARLTALRFLLNQTEYENKKLLKPLTWSKNINNYKVLLEGVEFNNLDYDQYMILSKYMDDE